MIPFVFGAPSHQMTVGTVMKSWTTVSFTATGPTIFYIIILSRMVFTVPTTYVFHFREKVTTVLALVYIRK
jgi:TM2 domain-containing membrane protein YozV